MTGTRYILEKGVGGFVTLFFSEKKWRGEGPCILQNIVALSFPCCVGISQGEKDSIFRSQAMVPAP